PSRCATSAAPPVTSSRQWRRTATSRPTSSNAPRRSSRRSRTTMWRRSTAWSSTRNRSCSKSEQEVVEMDERESGGEDGERRAEDGRAKPAEGVRIIGAEEAQAAIESGHAAGRRPEDAPRYGDVPAQPQGPRPPLRFPLSEAGGTPKLPPTSAPSSPPPPPASAPDLP